MKQENLIKDLKKERGYTLDQTKDIHKTLTDKCIDTVKILNGNGLTEYLYETPMMIFGYPIFDVVELSILVNKSLKKKGFKTFFVKPNKIFISWK